MPISLIPQSNSVSFSNGTSYAHICAMYENYLYVGSNSQTKDPYIFIYDVSDPAAPIKKTAWKSNEIATFTGNLTCININNGQMMLSNSGNFIYTDSSYFVYDLISNPLSPQIITSVDPELGIDTGTYISSVCSSGSFYFSASWMTYSGNNTLYSIQSKTNLSKVSTIISSFAGVCTNMLTKDIGATTYLFSLHEVYVGFGTNHSSLNVMSIDSINASLIELASVPLTTSNNYYSLTTSGNYIFALGESSVDIFDISNPSSPKLLSSIINQTGIPSFSAIIQSQIGLSITKSEINDNASPLYDISNILEPINQLNYSQILPLSTQINSFLYSVFPLGNQNCIHIDSNNYVYICYPTHLQTFYLYSDEPTYTPTPEVTPLVLQDRVPQLKSVQTIIMTKTGKVIANDASDNKGTLNTINAQSLSFGPLAAGETSETKIIYLNVPFANAIRNIKIGLMDTGSVPFATTSFGIVTREDLDYNISPDRYFTGLSDGTATNVNNVAVLNAGETFSQYVYINMKVPDNQSVGDGIVKLIWFFDYA